MEIQETSQGAVTVLKPTGPLTEPDAQQFKARAIDRKSTRLNSSHLVISYAVFCLKKKKKIILTLCLHIDVFQNAWSSVTVDPNTVRRLLQVMYGCSVAISLHLYCSRRCSIALDC